MDAIDEPQTPLNDAKSTWLPLLAYSCAIVYIDADFDASALFFEKCKRGKKSEKVHFLSCPRFASEGRKAPFGFIISVSSLHIHTLLRSRPADAPQNGSLPLAEGLLVSHGKPGGCSRQ